MTTPAGKWLLPVAADYGQQLKEQGIGPRAVFWNDAAGQELRFELLLEAVREDACKKGLSINDLGCGYGAFFDYIKDYPLLAGGSYFGYDICESMINAARLRINDPRARFMHSASAVHRADYSFASGTYNMKGLAPDGEWGSYVKDSLLLLWGQSVKGLAFNMLDAARKTRREDWLYYPEAKDYLDFCLVNMSPSARLLDSRPLAEWTIIAVR